MYEFNEYNHSFYLSFNYYFHLFDQPLFETYASSKILTLSIPLTLILVSTKQENSAEKGGGWGEGIGERGAKGREIYMLKIPEGAGGGGDGSVGHKSFGRQLCKPDSFAYAASESK